MKAPVYKSPVSRGIPFDNSDNGFISENAQEAIEEIATGGGTGVSPGFSFGRSGTTGSGTYLLNESVPSNITGRPVDLIDARIVQISVSNKSIATFSIEILEHDGTTYTSLGVYSITALRSKKFTGLNVSVSTGKELACRIASGSSKNPIVTVYVKGDAS